MKKLLLLPLVLFSMASCSEPKKGFSEEALNSAMISIDGETIAFKDILAQYKGKPVVIEVWASWCSDCAKGMPKLHALQEQFPDMQYLFLSYDRDLDNWKQGIKKNNLNGGHYHVSKSMEANQPDMAVTTGFKAFLSACRRIILISLNPFALAVRM